MIIPFLEILFDTAPMILEKPEFEFSITGFTSAFNYQVSYLIAEEGKVAALIFICIIVMVTSFLKNLSRYLAVFFITPARNGVTMDIRNSIFNKILHLPLSFFSEEKKGDILTRISSDAQEIEYSILNTISIIFKEPITVIFYLIALFVINPTLTLIILILLPLTGFVIGRISRKLKTQAQKGQSILATLVSIVEESLSGLRIIKAFNAEDNMMKKFSSENKGYYRIFTKLIRLRDLSSPLTEVLSTMAIVFILYVGGKMVLENNLEAGVFIGYLAIFTQLINPSKAFSSAYYQIQKGIASAERIEQILDADLKITEIENPEKVQEFEKEIVYENVSFAYNEEPILKNINIKIQKGKMVALVGQSGSGKSTFADLLPRFYDVTEGNIRIDQTDITNLKISDLRNLMGIVSQEAVLFNDTIYNNIAFSKIGASEAEIIEAAKIANAHEFIIKMGDGYQTNVGDRGNKLSGGERQRITIARAVLADPPILILDEATSSLDSHSERLVQEALFNLMKNRTSLIIAHRLSTIQYADEILVMQNGEIIERGNHNSLLSKNGIYKDLVEMQAF